MGKSNHLRPIYLTAISCMHLLNVLMQQKKKIHSQVNDKELNTHQTSYFRTIHEFRTIYSCKCCPLYKETCSLSS